MNFHYSTRIASVPARSGSLSWAAPLVVLAFFGLCICPAHAQNSAGSGRYRNARQAYKHGQQAEARQDYDTAYQDYQQAYDQHPEDLRYRTAYFRARSADAQIIVSRARKLLQSGNISGALTQFIKASGIDPSDEAAEQEIAKIREQLGAKPSPQSAIPVPQSEQQEISALGAPPVLKPVSNEPLTLHMTQDAKVIYEAVGKAAGINVLFDPDYHSNRIQVDLNNVSLMDALRILETVSNTFWRPVTSNTIFVAQNTRIKHTELDEQAVQTFYLTNAWQQNDMNDVQTALRSVIRNAQFYGVASQNAIVAKGTPDELLLAQKIIDDLDKARPEVVVDIAVLEVSKNWERNLGITWPQSLSVALQPPNASSNTSNNTNSGTGTGTGTTPTNSTGLTLYNLAHLNSTNFAVNVGQATLNLLLNNSQTQILQSPSIRATDGQKAILTVGSKIPIATGSYQTGAATALVSSLVNTQFQYIDVGVKITMTPTVHYDDDVTLNMDMVVSAESSTVNISGVTEPILSNREINQVIRLREGQASILGGIQDTNSQNNWTGIPGLSTIPILKYLFGSQDRVQNNDDIVFVVVPHVVRSESLTQANLRPIDTGAGQSIDLRMLQPRTPAASAQPASYVAPNLGTVPGSSAAGAAPAALQQLRSLDQNAANPQQPAAPPPQAAAPPQPNPAPQQPTPPPQSVPQQQPAQGAPQPVPPGGNAPAAAAPQPGPPASGAMTFDLNAPQGPVAAGSSFQVPVVLNGGTNVASVPLQLHYDPAHLSLVNVSEGNLLSRDGQAVALVHRDDGAGNLTIVASRPPGAAGLSGSGVVCVLTFQAKSAGPSVLAVTRAGIVNTAQQQVNAGTSQASITVK